MSWPGLFNNNKYSSIIIFTRLLKKLNIEWKSPGKIDPIHIEKHKEEAFKIGENLNKEYNCDELKNEVATIDSSNKFDPFEEFNNEIENEDKQIFDMRLVQNKSRENSNNKKVACMDKILDDIKKRYEYESELNQQKDLILNDESKQYFLHSDFIDESKEEKDNLTNKPNMDLENKSQIEERIDEDKAIHGDVEKNDEEIETFKQPEFRNSESLFDFSNSDWNFVVNEETDNKVG